MKKQLKLLSLAAALCGAVACSSGGGGTTTTGGPGTTGSSSGGATGSGPTGTAAGGSPTGTAAGGSGTAAGGSPTGTGGATSTGGASSTGGSSTGAPPPSTYPCVDGGAAYMPTNPPNNLTFCWCNPGDAGALTYYQIINSCPPNGSSPDLSIPLPPPLGSENIAGLAAAGLPLQVDAGVPGE